MKLTEFLEHVIRVLSGNKPNLEASSQPSEAEPPTTLSKAEPQSKFDETEVLEKTVLAVPLESWIIVGQRIHAENWVEAELRDRSANLWTIRMSPRSVFYNSIHIFHTKATRERYGEIIARLRETRTTELMDYRQKSLKELNEYVNKRTTPTPTEKVQSVLEKLGQKL